MARRRVPPPALSIDRRTTEAQLTQLVERVPPVAGVGAHLAGPAPRFRGFRPFPAYKHVRPVDLINRSVTRAVLLDPLLLPADIVHERLAPHPPRRGHAWHLQHVAPLLGVV